METVQLRSYRLEFAKRAEQRRDDEERRTFDQIKQKEEQDRKAEREQESEQDAILDIVTAVLATDTEIADFNVQLDTYDAATVEALMENEKQLKQVREELQNLLDQAYVLPDGRRVFKTKDGSRVFDEHGVEVKDIDPDEIEDWRPYWEKYQNPFERAAGLVAEREDVLEFQKLTDDVRAEVKHGQEHGGISSQRLEELKEKLADEAPDAVKRKLADDAPAQDADLTAKPDQKAVFRPIGKLDMPAI